MLVFHQVSLCFSNNDIRFLFLHLMMGNETFCAWRDDSYMEYILPFFIWSFSMELVGLWFLICWCCVYDANINLLGLAFSALRLNWSHCSNYFLASVYLRRTKSVRSLSGEMLVTVFCSYICGSVLLYIINFVWLTFILFHVFHRLDNWERYQIKQVMQN